MGTLAAALAAGTPGSRLLGDPLADVTRSGSSDTLRKIARTAQQTQDSTPPAAAPTAAEAVTSVMALLDPATAEVAATTPAPAADNDGTLAEVPQQAEPVRRPNGALYHPRKLGENTDVAALRAAREAGMHVLLAGPPGAGKTALLEAAFGEDLITFEGHGDAEVGDLIGGYIQRPDRSYLWVDGPAVQAAEQGKVLLLDDATLTPSSVLARMYPLMDDRGAMRVRENPERGEVRAARGFLVVAAHNPGVPGAVLSEALSSRFTVKVAVSTDLALARDLGVDHRMVRAAASLANARRSGVIGWAPEMRELLAFKRAADTFGLRFAAANLLGCAPEDEQAEVAKVLGAWLSNLAPLALGGRA